MSSIEESSDEKNVYTFGQNSYGELAHGDTKERYTPTLVEFCRNICVIDIAAGNEHSAILAGNGEVYTCGYNDSGQCGVGTTNRVTALRLVETLSDKNVLSLSSANGCEHLAALTATGELYTSGYNSRGQLGHGVTTHIARPQLVEALRGKRVVKVACSYFHTVVATDENDVYAFGRNDYGQLGLGTNLEDKYVPHLVKSLSGRPVLAIACGQYHTVVSLVGGGVYACGKNDYGQLGVEITEAKSRPILISSPLDTEPIVQLGCGYYHTVALTASGHVYSFGRNDYGQLGLGHKQNKWRPTLVDALEAMKIVQVACGCYHTVALCDGGKVYPFGRNNHGQLGLQNTKDTCTPQVIEGLRGKHALKVAAGFYHTICLTGSLYAIPRPPLQNTIASDFRKMINNEARSDVIFIVEGLPLYAHRCIIMARCEPLERMLDGPMIESQQLQITIPDHSHSVFYSLLEFLYTDSVEALEKPNVDVDFALDLLALADQFLVEGLKRKCEYVIQKSISPENVALMFRTADARQASGLRHRCFEFIMQNFGSVIGTSSFVELPQDLLQEVLSGASRRGVTINNVNNL